MKKFVSIMLALAMSMSLAACGADSSSDASSDSQSSSDTASGEKVVKIGVFEPLPVTPAPAAPSSVKRVWPPSA